MEPPMASSGSMLRRAATFNHRTERALKDINGRLGHVNRSQEHLTMSKTSVDGEKVTRPGKQYSAVASRYAAPPRYAAPLASKRRLSTVGDGPHWGQANVTKLPFITGRPAPQHRRRPSVDNLSSIQPSMVFSASARDPKPDTLTKKGDVGSNEVDAKRARMVKRTSMMEKKCQVQTRGTRFSSLDKGRVSGSKNGTVRGSVDACEKGSARLLYSAAHWVSLIKVAEGEKKHEVVTDLFRLAIKLKAEPAEDVVGQLKRYQESYPGDEVVIELVEQCEGREQEVCSANGEVIDKSVCETEESKSATTEPGGDVLHSETVIVPAVVTGNEAVMKKDAPQKPPHFMGRTLSRSSTFSCVDSGSQSQHAKAEYGKKLAKTMEFLALQAVAHSPSETGEVAEISPSEIQNLPLASVPEVETICKSTTTSEVEAIPSFGVASKILELASRVGSELAAQPASENFSTPVFEAGSTLVSGHDNGSAEKPVDSLSKWLDGESSGSPGVQSSLREDAVDFIPNRKTEVAVQSSPSKTQNAPLASVPVVETFSKSSSTLEVDGQSNVEPSEKLSTPMPAIRIPSLLSDDQATPSFKDAPNNVEVADRTLPNYSSPVSEVGSTLESAVCNGRSAEKPVDSLSEWLDGNSSEMGTPEIQSALSEETVDLSPDRRRAVKLMDVDSLMREVVSHILPDHIANSPADSQAAELNGAHELQMGGNNWQEAEKQSMTEIVENISRSHRHSSSAEAVLLSAGGGVEEKDPGSASKESHEAEVIDAKAVAPAASAADISGETDSGVDGSAESDSAVNIPAETNPPIKTVSAVENPVEAETATEIPAKTDSTVMQNEVPKVPLATPLRMSTKQRSVKGDTAAPSIPATPSAATPSEPASVGILRARHRRASSVGNMTPRGPFDMTGECSLFGDSSSSPGGQSSSAKSKRVSRGYKEVTPRMDLPKPSWKAIMEREMKGSRLKELLAGKLPEETSPLSEYVQSQMENQSRDVESGSMGGKEKDATSTCSPAKRMTKMTKQCSKKKPALKEEQQQGAAEPDTAQKRKSSNEGEQEMGASISGCPTPGSAVRRSARIQSKVQSRRNVLFKDEFVHL